MEEARFAGFLHLAVVPLLSVRTPHKESAHQTLVLWETK
ncbi:hypothetical protein CIP100294_00068 [Corynebacterium diphtheriae]|nr:hypothetical protein CIP100294_00068 [Corynebacterium diphtheriae]